MMTSQVFLYSITHFGIAYLIIKMGQLHFSQTWFHAMRFSNAIHDDGLSSYNNQLCEYKNYKLTDSVSRENSWSPHVAMLSPCPLSESRESFTLCVTVLAMCDVGLRIISSSRGDNFWDTCKQSQAYLHVCQGVWITERYNNDEHIFNK